MKLIIAGSRNIGRLTAFRAIARVLNIYNLEPTEIVSGHARGVDKFGEQFAEQNNITTKIFPADWKQHGRSAGYIRNVEMGEYGDALLAVWDGVSKGTKHMIDIATEKGLEVYIDSGEKR